MLPIRKKWFSYTVKMCQELSLAPRPWLEAPVQTLHRIRQAVKAPAVLPRGPIETLVLRGLFLDLALEWCRQVNAGIPPSMGARLSSAALVEKYWKSRTTHPSDMFLQWAAEFFSAIEEQRLIGAADRAALVLDANYAANLTLAAVARQIGVSPTDLRVSFRQRFGTSLSDYRRKQRVERAVKLLAAGQTKVETVAALVGYRSKKNFYRAVRSVTGTTPRKLR